MPLTFCFLSSLSFLLSPLSSLPIIHFSVANLCVHTLLCELIYILCTLQFHAGASTHTYIHTYIHRFADWNHPRKVLRQDVLNPDPTLAEFEKFDLWQTNTGRHCVLGGLGEQCDLWEEGKWSEFAAFGPGVTLYFKFLKWLYWMSFLLAAVLGPTLLINTFGPQLNVDNRPLLTDLARTTVGNLAAAINSVNTTTGGSGGAHSLTHTHTHTHSDALLLTHTHTGESGGVVFPFCAGEGNIYDVNCYLEKDYLSFLYSWLDLFGMVVYIIGMWWLYTFEAVEERDLLSNDTSASASDYTVKVTNLPQQFTRVELMEHFNKILGKRGVVVDANVAYDDEDIIQIHRTREDLVKRKGRKG